MKSNKPIRRSQLISPFGVGAIVNFPNDEALMTMGLEFWPKAHDECPGEWKIEEERLQKRLGKTHFRLPPDFREQQSGGNVDLSNQTIPFLRFPRWYYCPKCGNMQKLSPYGTRVRCHGKSFEKASLCSSLPEDRRPFLIPARFITICEKGHIEDFPFMEWVHRGKEYDHTHKLRMMAGRSTTSLTGTCIDCSCGASATMGGSFNLGALDKIGYTCSGLQPWLGKNDGHPGDCGTSLRVVQRGASNVYFPDIKSSIYIPISGAEQNSREINKLIDDPKVWDSLSAIRENGHISKQFVEGLATIYSVDPDSFYRAAEAKLNQTSKIEKDENNQDDEISYRFSEYQAILKGVGGETTELSTERRFAENYAFPWSDFFSDIVLVKKLRETRVLSGFSRLLPFGDREEIQLQRLYDDENISWLPGMTVYGEGIFFKFNDELIEAWSRQPNVTSRINSYSEKQNEYRKRSSKEPVYYSAKLLMIHTFAHLVINQLSHESGYGSSSIRERIYCDDGNDDKKMSGVLLYTASGDSEGTLGGLVRQGEPDRLPEILNNAIDKAKWCTNDPVCIESDGQGINNSNLAACHSCALIAETSCEMGNRILDRAMLIGTIADEALGFFNQR